MLIALFSGLPMWICMFWVLILLLNTKHSNLPKKFLVLFFLISFINYFAYASYFNSQYNLYCFMENIWIFTSLSVFPLYYYYIRLLTKDNSIKFFWIWLIIPSLLVSLFSWALYFIIDPSETNVFIYNVMYNKAHNAEYPPIIKLQIFKQLLFKIVFVVQVLFVLCFGLKHIASYNKDIRDFYSSTGGKDINPIKLLLILLIFTSIVSSLSAIIGKSRFIENEYLILIPSITHSISLFIIGYIGNKQDFTIADFIKEINKVECKEAKYSSASSDLKPSEIKREFLILLEQNKIFKNANLRISDISHLVGTNRTYYVSYCK